MVSSSLKEIFRVRVFGGNLTKWEHQSSTLRLPAKFAIFIPDKASEKTRVNSVYWLSGLTCSEDNFTQKAGGFKQAAAQNLALVVPDTSPRGAGIPGEDDDWDFGTAAGFYVDAITEGWKKNYNMYSYITKELPDLVESNFPVTMKKSVFGHSMGGHGALVVYLKNPGLYESVSAFAPICNPSKCPWGEKAFSGYLGDDREEWKQYDACDLVGSFKGKQQSILVDQGMEDGFYPKKQLLPENFVAACEKANHPLVMRYQEGYDHSYFFISTFIDDHIKHHALALNGHT
eukprot:266495_1